MWSMKEKVLNSWYWGHWVTNRGNCPLFLSLFGKMRCRQMTTKQTRFDRLKVFSFMSIERVKRISIHQGSICVLLTYIFFKGTQRILSIGMHANISPINLNVLTKTCILKAVVPTLVSLHRRKSSKKVAILEILNKTFVFVEPFPIGL